MDEIPSAIANSIESAGWKPGKRINEGGGGTVFVCFPKSYIDLFEELMSYSRTQIHGIGGSPSQFAIKMGNRLTSDNSFLTPSIGAVKIPHAVISEETDKRLREEIRAMASFSHPNLIRLLAHDPAPSPSWFIMEYYPKGTLDDNR